jgi:hypothetical protein
VAQGVGPEFKPQYHQKKKGGACGVANGVGPFLKPQYNQKKKKKKKDWTVEKHGETER